MRAEATVGAPSRPRMCRTKGCTKRVPATSHKTFGKAPAYCDACATERREKLEGRKSRRDIREERKAQLHLFRCQHPGCGVFFVGKLDPETVCLQGHKVVIG